MKLPLSYYSNQDVLFLAQDLLGKVLFTNINGEITAGIIVETEAYFGIQDKASHAYGGRRTHRTETLYAHGGVSYVYLCYGIHHLFNVVTSVKDEPHAVLVRAIEPLIGKEIMEKRRQMPVSRTAISSGPGSLAKALGINQAFNKKDLIGNEIWIEDHGIAYNPDEIAAGPRIGVAYAEEDAHLPWRFFVKGNKYVSKPNKV
ncbi:DNA-3-methyladenine glycosylase [Chryseobacterium indologenes]|uniref:DNA-3-methyladenine glycosylase n=1 Tax=Chryseobacterium indologenes TaxID=253 RepID=UPI000F4FF977|nr:DNA-3-methyladenine glycosylase [Chryseobacterium indologenes]AYZ35657.1 DNA-3-methyladenine glycosylase [Chryseobacterium indologenes]MBF6644421.1 DNA-3-methyladenine glycosylase [Chryseobacterium indologenes]MBU3046605.1 DNA-3-methyladenine glycosylase [Chryseobacterium indologenes]MEB4760022.1 DNA-3-methyladenine glycosylase [Chryseobacterium indologenes]QQQ71875.1 DNA-3-methyladenine glycosylase [Chryseobacterium indologenes]